MTASRAPIANSAPASSPPTPPTPATPAPHLPAPLPLSPQSAISKKLKGGRRAANPHLTDEQRRRERVLKNRESAMKSLQKKKRYTEDLEHRARALASRNQELRDKIRLLLTRLQQMGIVAVPPATVLPTAVAPCADVFSPPPVHSPFNPILPSTPTPIPNTPPPPSQPLPSDWPLDFTNVQSALLATTTPTEPTTSATPMSMTPSLQLSETVQVPASTHATAEPDIQNHNDVPAMPNQSASLMHTPPRSPVLPLPPEHFSLSESDQKLSLFDVPHMACQ